LPKRELQEKPQLDRRRAWSIDCWRDSDCIEIRLCSIISVESADRQRNGRALRSPFNIPSDLWIHL
jgi:hypothetical protein